MRRMAANASAARSSLVQAPFRVCQRHVVGHIDDGVAGRSQVRELDDAWHADALVGDIDPEMRCLLSA